MDCSQFKSGIFAFREGTLSEEEHHLSERHLASCLSCNRLFLEFGKVEAIIAHEKAVEPNPFAATRILQHLEHEFERPNTSNSPVWIRILQPVAIAIALLSGILIGSYTAKKDIVQANQVVNTSGNIEFLRSNLFISEFADEDKILVINK